MWTDSVSEIEPAYGRDYKSKSGAQSDLNCGNDFIAQPSGRYINAEQLRELNMSRVILRYGKRRKVTELRVPTEAQQRKARADREATRKREAEARALAAETD